MKRYKKKFRIDSARLNAWDYKNLWWYYVTICTKDHKDFFGEIINGEMVLNKFGKIVDDLWLKIPVHYPEIELDYYVIMPNHIHGIIILNSLTNVETGHAPSLQRRNDTQSKNKQHSLGNVVGSFKSAVTRWAHKNGYKKYKWQTRFYDRIIRNEKELYRIRKYIEQNPLKWGLGKNQPENIDL